jgi:excisionase family DNA binding protein
MSNQQPLTLTVEQAADVLGVGRSTAYELVRSGDLRCIRLRRRIVVPVAHLAESLGVDRDAVWATLNEVTEPPASAARGASSEPAPTDGNAKKATESTTLF